MKRKKETRAFLFSGSLILGDYHGASGRANLEVVVQKSGSLNHYYRKSDALNWILVELVS